MKKLVVITGASSGFGRELAKEFAKDGYPLLLLARRLEKLEELNLDNCLCKKVDVTDKNAFAKAVKEAEEVYGKVDLLINNAGIMLLGSIETQNSDEWQKMLDTNVMGVMNGMQIVLNDMKERKCGTIINISSLAGVKAFGNHAAYCASKFGVMGLSETVRQEVCGYNVRVMRVCPGAVDTELISHTTDKNLIDGYMQWKEATGAVNIRAVDVARTIKFAYELPQCVNLREIQIADTKQDG